MFLLIFIQGNATIKDRADFQSELETMKRIGRHRNVVSLIGACEHEGKVLIYEKFISIEL